MFEYYFCECNYCHVSTKKEKGYFIEPLIISLLRSSLNSYISINGLQLKLSSKKKINSTPVSDLIIDIIIKLLMRPSSLIFLTPLTLYKVGSFT